MRVHACRSGVCSGVGGAAVDGVWNGCGGIAGLSGRSATRAGTV